MTTATQRLLDLVSAAHGNCSDYRIGKLMGVSSSAVSRWRLGHSHMSQANVGVACNLISRHMDEGRWQAFVGAEREHGPDGDFWREMRAQFERMDAGKEPEHNSWLYMLIHGTAGKAAAILAAAVLGLFLTIFPNNQAVAATPPSAESTVHGMYYANFQNNHISHDSGSGGFCSGCSPVQSAAFACAPVLTSTSASSSSS